MDQEIKAPSTLPFLHPRGLGQHRRRKCRDQSGVRWRDDDKMPGLAFPRTIATLSGRVHSIEGARKIRHPFTPSTVYAPDGGTWSRTPPRWWSRERRAGVMVRKRAGRPCGQKIEQKGAHARFTPNSGQEARSGQRRGGRGGDAYQPDTRPFRPQIRQ